MGLGIKASITVIEGDDRGKTVNLQKPRTVIGRARGDFRLADRKISSEHLCLIIEEGKLFLEDLASTNGTFVNGTRVDARVELKNLDEISLGFSKCRVTLVEDLAEFRQANVARPQPSPARQRGKKNNPAPPASGGLGSLIDDELKRFSRWDIVQADSAPGFDRPSALPKVPVTLTVVAGPEKGRVIKLSKGNSVIGRGKVEVKLRDHDVSRQHASIECFSPSQIFIRDMASTNGIFLNGKKISYSKLNSGDKVQIGSTILRIEVGAEQPDDAEKG